MSATKCFYCNRRHDNWRSFRVKKHKKGWGVFAEKVLILAYYEKGGHKKAHTLANALEHLVAEAFNGE